MKKLSFLLIILGVCVLTGCAFKSNTAAASASANTNTSTASNTVENKLVYENTEYGFKFFLPSGWENYSIITDKWKGNAPGADAESAEEGPLIYIRHPLWTKEKPRQDIPIMIMTLKQWDALQKDEFGIGAAGISPKELGRNEKYVFALPARYNFAYPEGYEEVDYILQHNALKPTGLEK
ncbi:MAG: hypothetical protein K0R50_2228 [Eubacterium sp.]|jgi:hypothetical protein|nr:hypothetical protein [Eubacterium sp.]